MPKSFSVDSTTGLLHPCLYKPSPHQDDRPLNVQIELLVIHNISLPPAEFGHSFIEDFFCGTLDFSLHPYFLEIQTLRVSAHLLIKRNGDIVQFVPFHKRAWHAGVSSFQGKNHCNDFSIGIELEGTDNLAYTSEQYEKLAAVTKLLLDTYPAMSLDKIVGHCDIAPDRKTDPGMAFDWQLLKGMLR